MLKVIKCTPRYELYRKAYVRKVEELLNNKEKQIAQNVMPVVFLGVRALVTSRSRDEKNSADSLMAKFREIEAMIGLISLLTPRQFINVFPITKRYDGAKYETKDYFYTMEMIQNMDLDSSIGEKIDDFLWDYMNRDISLFQVERFHIGSEIMRAQGQPGLMERISSDFGIPIYTLDKRGKTLTGPIQVENIDDEYCYNYSDAKNIPYLKPLPDYLKLVKA